VRYFSPNLAPGWLDGGAPTGPTDHFGGWPWGLPLERWPACRERGGALTFIAQFQHDALRLDLGAEGRVLFLFWCLRDPYICAVWEPDGGANAAIVLDREECTVSASSADAPMEPYVTILSWSEHDDGVSAAEYRDFLDGEASPFANDAWHVDFDVRLGGTPYWSNGPPMHEMDGSWRFAAQLTEGVYLSPPVPTPDQLGCKVVFQHQPSEWGNAKVHQSLTVRDKAVRTGIGDRLRRWDLACR
jgi:hypothetical protein